TVTINGTSASDAIAAVGNSTSPTVRVGLLKTVTLIAANTESAVIAAGDGDDKLSIDSSLNRFPIPLIYDGGTGLDTLALAGGPASTDVYTPGPNPGSGTSTITFTGGVPGTQTVNFLNLEPVVDTVNASALIVNGTNADDAIDYTAASMTLGAGVGGTGYV